MPVRSDSQTNIHDSSHYREKGFLICEKLFSENHIDALRKRMQEIAEGQHGRFPLSDIEREPNASATGWRSVRKINRCAENDPL
ncbi:MAG: hypothetical protein KDA84_28855, partial [Planctomycetaceae bacterium]|nr:hypothetical protein [Planctomycetaceae bacterium]